MLEKDFVSRKFTESIFVFCKKTAKFKTPVTRTSGAEEADNQSRGEADWIDSVATIMLWRELAYIGLPVTYYLTANGGDETDLRVQFKGNSSFIDINVKGTKASIPVHMTPAQYGNIAIKQEELGLKLKKVDGNYEKHPSKVVLENDSGKYWAVSDKRLRLADIYIKVFVHQFLGKEDEASVGEVHLTNWIHVGSEEFSERVAAFNEKMAKGQPEIIPGIKHPGLWIDSNSTKRFPSLLGYLEEFIRNNGATNFQLSRRDK